jgi:hypothetical protein
LESSYIPEALPIKEIDHRRLLPPVGDARGALATYAGLLEGLVNPRVVLSPLISEEAVASSKNEGTQATQYELFQFEAGMEQSEEKGHDIQEIQKLSILAPSRAKPPQDADELRPRGLPALMGGIGQVGSSSRSSCASSDCCPCRSSTRAATSSAIATSITDDYPRSRGGETGTAGSTFFLRAVRLQSEENASKVRLLRKIKAAGLLTEIREARGQRPAALCFPELLKKITES